MPRRLPYFRSTILLCRASLLTNRHELCPAGVGNNFMPRRGYGGKAPLVSRCYPSIKVSGLENLFRGLCLKENWTGNPFAIYRNWGKSGKKILGGTKIFYSWMPRTKSRKASGIVNRPGRRGSFANHLQTRTWSHAGPHMQLDYARIIWDYWRRRQPSKNYFEIRWKNELIFFWLPHQTPEWWKAYTADGQTFKRKIQIIGIGARATVAIAAA